ncbi:MAG: 5'-nucleotidase [Turicibacter sp.]|nr:5'-nucleotidase [Turicibacter sp.]
MRPVKIAVEIGLLFNLGDEIHVLDSLFTRMVQRLLSQNFHPVKFYWVLNCCHSKVQQLEEKLRKHNFVGETAHFEGNSGLLNYLDRCDLFFSKDYGLLYEVSEQGILGGFIHEHALNATKLVLAFDHRIFMDEHNQPAITGWLRLIGQLQRGGGLVTTALITTSSGSVEKRVIEMFQRAGCSINELFYLGAGTKKDVFRLFGPCLYFEGKRRREMKNRFQGRPLLFV